jgi:hypothetical protein
VQIFVLISLTVKTVREIETDDDYSNSDRISGGEDRGALAHVI